MIVCPRCRNGYLLKRISQIEELVCAACGHEVYQVPADVLTEVAKFHGKENMPGIHTDTRKSAK